MSDLTKLAAQTPLIDLLRGVPADARMTYEVNPTHHHMIPVGRLCADAVADLSNLAAELAEVKKERDALKALLAEWLDGMYQGPDFLRRVKIAVHGTLAEIVRGAKE